MVVRGTRPVAVDFEFNGTVEDFLAGVQVRKSPCTLLVGKSPVEAVCTRTLFHDGRELRPVNSSDVIVFDAPRFKGLVVHRVFSRILNGTNEFFLTKGDNNLGVDQEVGLPPVAPQDVKGVVIARIPSLGFFKLLLFLQFTEPLGCSELLQGGN